MEEPNEAVMQEIQREIRRRPGISPGILFQLAVQIDPGVASLHPRKFHITYVLPVRQRISAEARASRRLPARQEPARGARQRRIEEAAGSRAEPPVEVPVPAQPRVGAAEPPVASVSVAESASAFAARATIRTALMDFARDLSAAERRAELVRVVIGVDQYVDRVLNGPHGRPPS